MKKLLSSFFIFLFLCVSPASAFMNYPSRYFSGVAIKNVKNYGTYRAWSNGSLASTCDEYKNPTNGIYTGDTGDGIYRITNVGGTFDVYCLMSYDSDGWVLAGGKPTATNVTLTDIPYSATNPFVAYSVLKNYTFNKNRAMVERSPIIANSTTDCGDFFNSTARIVYNPESGYTLKYNPSWLNITFTNSSNTQQIIAPKIGYFLAVSNPANIGWWIPYNTGTYTASIRKITSTTVMRERWIDYSVYYTDCSPNVIVKIYFK